MIFGLMYILYRSGCAVMNRKYALLYTEYPRMGKRRSCIEARFLSCSWSHQKSNSTPAVQKIPVLSFRPNTTKGSVCVEIYGTQNALMATLNNEQPCLIISTEKNNGLPGCHEIQKRRWRIQADLEGVQAAERVCLAAFSTKRKALVRPRPRPGFLKGNLAAGPPHAARSDFPWRIRGPPKIVFLTA